MSIQLLILKRYLVMLVDDEINITGLFTEILTLNRINVHQFTDPEEVLRDYE